MKNKILSAEIYTDNALVSKIIKELGHLYIEYDEIINEAIRERYSINKEFAILRQRDTKPDEFAEYNAYVEKCKTKAKEIWARQEDTINRLLKEKGMS